MRVKIVFLLLFIFAATLVFGEEFNKPNKTVLYPSYPSFEKMFASTESVFPPLKTITKGPNYHWFGYYLHDILDPSGRYLLSAEVDFDHRLPKSRDSIKVGMIDLLDNNKWIELGTSKAWSWQQQCFLQWRPASDSEVLWNDRKGRKAITRSYDIKTKTMRILPGAIDEAISSDGKWALCSDFSRTWKASAGYGYPGIANKSTNVPSPKSVGITRMNLDSGETKLLISLAELKNLSTSRILDKDVYRYVAHYDWNPDSKRFSAYYRGDWTIGTQVYTFDADGKNIRLLSDSGASHWAWRDNESMLIWTIDKGYQIYTDDGSGREKELIWKAPNGHQTYIPGTNNEWIITDTYPLGDKREQLLYLVCLPTKRFIQLARLCSPKSYKGHWRSDLHPCISRDGSKVFIQSPHAGNGRQIYMIDISDVIKNVSEY